MPMDLPRDERTTFASEIAVASGPDNAGWQRCMKCLKSQDSSRKRAINYGARLRKLPYNNTAFYGSIIDCSFCRK